MLFIFLPYEYIKHYNIHHDCKLQNNFNSFKNVMFKNRLSKHLNFFFIKKQGSSKNISSPNHFTLS